MDGLMVRWTFGRMGGGWKSGDKALVFELQVSGLSGLFYSIALVINVPAPK